MWPNSTYTMSEAQPTIALLMGKIACRSKLRQRASKKHGFIQQGINVLRDSLSLMPKKKTSKESDENYSLQDENPSTSTGMETLCLIDDNGLDDGDGTADTSIEAVRDASFTSPKLYDIPDLPSIVINRPDDCQSRNSFENTKHLNIKQSTMNQSAMEAHMEDMENLSPITKSKKRRKKIKLLDAPNSLPEDDFRDFTSESEPERTGNTPTHVRKVMKKLRNAGKKKLPGWNASPKLDINHNSMETKTRTDGDVISDLSDQEHSDEWSPSKMNKNWLQVDGPEEPKKTFLRSDLLPEWKKCIQKPLADERSFRTSSPSPLTLATQLPATKETLLQISSIHESDVSICRNFKSRPERTINSDEIVPFSSSSLHSGDILCPGIVVDEGHDALDIANGIEGQAGSVNEKVVPTRKRPAFICASPNGSVLSDELCSFPSPIVCIRRTNIKPPNTLHVPTDEIELFFSD